MAEIGISQHQLVEDGGSGAHPGRKLPQYIAALSATLGALAAGSMLGWSSPVGPQINEVYDFPITETQADWAFALINLGAAFICFPIGLIMDVIGRKLTMLALVAPFTVGWILIIWANNVPMLMIGRVITGMAGGAFCVTAPAYTSEISQDSIRGTLGSYFQLMITVGILFSYAVGSYVPIFIFNILCGIIPLVFGVIFFFMPESPKYLVVKEKYDEARSALIRLRGEEYDYESELQNLKEKKEEALANPVPFRQVIVRKSSIKAVIIVLCLMFFQQMAGINAVIFNMATIFKSADVALSTEISTIIVGVVQVIATFTSSLVVDRLGRRILLLFSGFVMMLCSLALGIFFFLLDTHTAESDIVQSIGWLPVLSLALFIIAFSLGYGPIPWMIAGDICPLNIKAFISSFGGTFNWLLSFTVTMTFNTLSNSIGMAQVFWIYAGVSLVGFVFVFFVVPETKGKSIEEMLVILGGQPPEPSISQTKEITQKE